MRTVRQRLGDFPVEIVAPYVLPAALVLAVVIWGILISWAGPLILLGSVAMLGVTFLFINQHHDWQQRRRQESSLLEPESTLREIEETLRDWLYQAGYQVGKAELVAGEQFKFTATQINQQLTIGKVEAEELIIINRLAAFEPQHVQKFNALSAERQLQFFHDLRKNLILLGVGFINADAPLRPIEVRDAVDWKGLTRPALLQSALLVNRGGALIAELFYEATGQ